MGIWGWAAQNGFELLSAIGIVVGLWFTAVSLYSVAKAQRIANLITLTGNHHGLMSVFYKNSDLTRILDASADITSAAVSYGEQIYVTDLIQHLYSAYRAMQSDLTIKPEGLRLDVREFFALPIPKFVWEKTKQMQDADFVEFIESSAA